MSISSHGVPSFGLVNFVAEISFYSKRACKHVWNHLLHLLHSLHSPTLFHKRVRVHLNGLFGKRDSRLAVQQVCEGRSIPCCVVVQSAKVCVYYSWMNRKARAEGPKQQGMNFGLFQNVVLVCCRNLTTCKIGSEQLSLPNLICTNEI